MATKHFILPIMLVLSGIYGLKAQSRMHKETDVSRDSISITGVADTVRFIPDPIVYRHSPDLFIPYDRLRGLTPWMSAPITRPEIHVIPMYGFSGYGFGNFTVDHFDKFFSNLLGYNGMDAPGLIRSEQMLLGNTIALGKKRRLFFANGILYGRQYGVWGNMIGVGTREGLVIRPSDYLILTLWTQEYQPVYAFTPLLYPVPGSNDPHERLPASPLVISYGAQAYFLAGQFWVGIGLSLWTAAGEH